jgi:protein TonB
VTQVAPPADVVAGTPDGDPAGVPEGMPGGVRDGAVGGVPGGTPGGEIGGTGHGPVLVKDYDRPPRLLLRTQPVYPPGAFKDKVQGTVVVEIVIGADGRVVRAHVLKSISALDAAALAAVQHWMFAPAMKNGVPVPTSAVAPVSFRIY